MTVKEALSQVCRKKLAIRTHSVVEKSLLIGACGMHGYDVSLCSPELWDLYPTLYKATYKNGRSLTFSAENWPSLRAIPVIDFADLTGMSTEMTAEIEEKLR